MKNKYRDIDITADGRIILYAHGIMYRDEDGVIKDKILGPLSDLNSTGKVKELNNMLLEDSKKLQAEKKDQLDREELRAFQARKKRLKDDMIVDLDAKPKKQAGRPKGSKAKKQNG